MIQSGLFLFTLSLVLILLRFNYFDQRYKAENQVSETLLHSLEFLIGTITTVGSSPVAEEQAHSQFFNIILIIVGILLYSYTNKQI